MPTLIITLFLLFFTTGCSAHMSVSTSAGGSRMFDSRDHLKVVNQMDVDSVQVRVCVYRFTLTDFGDERAVPLSRSRCGANTVATALGYVGGKPAGSATRNIRLTNRAYERVWEIDRLERPVKFQPADNYSTPRRNRDVPVEVELPRTP